MLNEAAATSLIAGLSVGLAYYGGIWWHENAKNASLALEATSQVDRFVSLKSTEDIREPSQPLSRVLGIATLQLADSQECQLTYERTARSRSHVFQRFRQELGYLNHTVIIDFGTCPHQD